MQSRPRVEHSRSGEPFQLHLLQLAGGNVGTVGGCGGCGGRCRCGGGGRRRAGRTAVRVDDSRQRLESRRPVHEPETAVPPVTVLLLLMLLLLLLVVVMVVVVVLVVVVVVVVAAVVVIVQGRFGFPRVFRAAVRRRQRSHGRVLVAVAFAVPEMLFREAGGRRRTAATGARRGRRTILGRSGRRWRQWRRSRFPAAEQRLDAERRVPGRLSGRTAAVRDRLAFQVQRTRSAVVPRLFLRRHCCSRGRFSVEASSTVHVRGGLLFTRRRRICRRTERNAARHGRPRRRTKTAALAGGS